jgi:ParB family chromosome partitioning protein
MTEGKKSRLGRGLDALLGGDEAVPLAGAAPGRSELGVDAIEVNPYQPRKEYDADELASLGDSIRNHGILQPLVVRQVGDRFQLIAGERRLRAAKAVGLSSVPVTVVDFNDQQTLEAALVENMHRADLNPIEKALGFKDYLDRYTATHEQLAARLGVARSSVTNLVNLLEMPDEIQGMLMRGELSLGHAKVLKGVTDPDRLLTICKQIVSQGLSVQATGALVKQASEADKSEPQEASAEPRSPAEKTAHVKGIEDELRHKLGLKIEIKVKGKEKGQIVLAFDTNEDFERAVEALRK